jgi:Abnormal spindle-like microcephaly-assoc'd, ASPM-SPD-2-Hydin/Beta-propeller repeat
MEAKFFQNGVDFFLPEQKKGSGTLRLELLSTDRNATPVAEEPLSGKSNYLLGSDSARWIRNVPNYARVSYQDIYPGISLVFYGAGSELEHDFTVAAGADASSITFQLQGARKTYVSTDGDLKIQLDAGTLTLKKPVAYQTSSQGRKHVDANFLLTEDGIVRFRLGAYDSSRPLVIDPVFSFSTYVTGTGTDEVAAITTDASGNIYLTGYTNSTDFPIQSAEQPQLGCNPTAPGGCENAFITKLDPTGKLVFSTYLGGSDLDQGAAIAVDANGNVIVAGVTESSDFPHAGAVSALTCPINNNCYFLASLKPDGSALNYSGQVGGAEGPYSSNNGRLAVDPSGNAYLAGITNSPNFQITSGTLAPSFAGYPNIASFVLKIDPTGKLIYSTVIPGSAAPNLADVFNNFFQPTGITADSSGTATVAGTGGPGLPTTSGVIASTFPNLVSAGSFTAGYVMQLNATASAVNYGTYVPGTDSLGGLAIDNGGNLYVTGDTSETTLPVSANAYQKNLIPGPGCICNSGYIVELNAQATSILAASYLSGTPSLGNEGTSFTSIALDSHSNVFVGGYTGSTDFPLHDPFSTQWEITSTAWEMVLAEMPANLSSVSFGSYLSSTSGSSPYPGSTFSALTIDPSDNLVVAGMTYASDFPTTPGSLEPQPPPPPSPFSNTVHSFVSKINMATPAPSFCPSTWSVGFGLIPAQTPSTQTINITNCGNAPLVFNAITSSVPSITATQSCGSVVPGGVCPVTLTFTPTNSSVVSGTINFADNAVISPQIIQVSGHGQAPDLEPESNPLSFGDLLVGTQEPPIGLFIYNNGNAPLTISSVSISGNGFSIAGNGCTGTFPGTNNPSGNNFACLIGIVFSPSTAGASNGTLTIASNDPAHPQLVISLTGTGDTVYAVPVISSFGFVQGVAQQTVQINDGPVTLQVSGSNFYPASVVQINGIAQQTTFESNGVLQVTVAASSLTALGELPVVVVNPTPGGGTSQPATLTPYQVLPLSPSFFVYVPATKLLYASMPAASSSNPNTVIPIDPTTGAIGTPIAVGKDPQMLAASDDGKYLYVALNDDQAIQRINLSTLTVEQTFPYPPNQVETVTPLRVADMHVVPGSSLEVVVAVTDSEALYGGMVALYNNTGLVNAVPTTYPPLIVSSFAFTSDPSTLYALPLQQSYFNVLTLDSGGIHAPVPGYSPNPQTGAQVVSDGTLLYTSAGEVWNPSTQTKVGTYPVSTYNDTSYPNLFNLAVDSSLKQIYVIGNQSYNGSTATVLSSYGMQSLALQYALPFFQISSPTNLVRWGADGFGFVVPPGTGSGIYLTRSSSVTQQLNPTPTLTSISPTAAIAGAPPFTLTVVGTGFISTSIVNWNGTALVTTYVSSTQLTAAVPASDVVTSGTAQVTVATPTPGGGTSSALTLSINPAVPGAVVSNSALSFGSITVGSSSTAQTVTLTNSGSATLSITSITVAGDFEENSTCGNSLSVGANCSISITFAPTAVGTRTGSLTIADNASDSSQTVALTGTGMAPVVTAPTVTLSLTSLTFSSQTDGTTSATQTVTMTNSGTANLTIASIVASGDFAQANNCGTSLSAGSGCMISVTFTPTAAGTRAGTLTITDNAGGSPQTVALSGGGQAVSVSTNSTALSIPSAGGTATAMIQLSSIDGFTGTVNLTCAVTYQGQGIANSPPTCSLNPSQEQVTGNSPVSSTLTVSSTTASASTAPERTSSKYCLAFALLLFFGALPRRRWRGGVLFLAVCLAAWGGMLGCSGSNSGGSNNTAPPVSGTTTGNYQVRVTATSGTVTTSTTIPLSIQ